MLTSLFRIVLTRSLKPFIFENMHENKLEFQDLDELGLYVHIPFCRTLCSFCPYCKEKYDKKRAEVYKGALLKEIDLACNGMKNRKQVTSLYFGGGTPALMIADLKDIIDKLKEYFIITDGIGVELHPDDISLKNLDQLKGAGVTMISIGIQSFDEDCLRKLGRTSAKFEEKLSLASGFGFNVVDVDLIFAIPGQTDEILKRDIKTAFDNGATQISTYPFIDFTFADNKYKPMSERIKKRMLKNMTGFCSKIGMVRTSVWTFAKPGTDKYSSVTRDSFLGFGLSATSLLKNSFKINTFSLEGYIKRIEKNILPTSLTLTFSKRQRAVYYMFWSAYALKINMDKFERIIGKPFNRMYWVESLLARMVGLISKRGKNFELTEKGALFYHHLEQAYTTAYIDKMWNVMRSDAFPDRIILK